MMSFESNTIHFDPSKIHEIEEKLELDGCVRVQFTEEHLPEDYHVKENIELFFIGLIEKLGGQCLKHNTDTNSIVWHVQPNTQSPNGKHNKLARSETFEEFAFHTDCSYEENPPEYIAMLVLETDKLGGGQTEIIRLSDVLEHLPAETIEKLLSEKVQINVPEEFRKQSHIDHISETILLDPNRIRYREDILSGKSLEHVDQLRLAINQAPRYKPNLEKYTMILLNNQTYLHGRTKVLDQRRHLLRIRFNRLPPYNIFSILDHAKFMREHLTFESEFYSYFDQQHENLHKILKLIVEQYSQPTHLGEEIRQTFAFKPKTHDILMQLNLHKPDFCTGSYRPDVILGPGDLFRMNGVQPFRPKMCEINGRFPLNGYLMSVSVLFNDHPNQCAERFSRLLDTIIKSAKLDTSKPLFILKGRERGFDVHCFQKYWTKKYSRPCSFIDPNRLTVKNNLLFDAKGNHVIEQCILELHQDEILQLSDDVLQVLIRSEELNYFNDLRTIFLLHDKRLFTLLSNQEFLYALLNQVPQQFIDFIPSTFVVSKIPNYLKDCIINNKHDWCIKPNLFGKGEDVTMGPDVTLSEWTRLLTDPNHEQWIVQEYFPSVQYKSMNISANLYFFNEHCFNIGLFRLSPQKVVTVSHGGYFIRPYVHRAQVFSTKDASVLSKAELSKELSELRSTDNRWNQNVYVSASGGSAGKRLYFLTDIKENLLQRQIFANMMMEHNIICHNDVCLNLFEGGNLYRASDILNDICNFTNCTVLPMHNSASDEHILQTIEYFQPNIFMGTPYRLMQLALFIEQQSGKEITCNKIIFACEPLDEIKQKCFKRVFHCSIFIGVYGSAEAGPFACQLPQYSSTKTYIYPKELVHLEIVDSKIVVTNLIRKINQIIRFDTGDQGRLLPTDENAKYGLVEVLYGERIVCLDNTEFLKSDLEALAKEIDVIEWQLIIDYIPYSRNYQVCLLFRYVQSSLTIDETVQQTIRDYLLKVFKDDLSEFQRQVVLQFEPVDYKDLIRDKVSSKLLKIIDRRV